MNRPLLPPITTTRSIHIPDPCSVLHKYINSCPHKVPTATKTKRKTPLPTLPQNLDLPSSSNIPITFLPEPSLKSPTKKSQQYPTPSPSELSSFTFSQIYPKLELQRVHSTTTSSLTDLYHKDKDSDSTASTRVPRHNYNLRSQQQRDSQELQSLTSSSTKQDYFDNTPNPDWTLLLFSHLSPLYHLLYHYHFKSHKDLKQPLFFLKSQQLYQIAQLIFHELTHLVQ